MITPISCKRFTPLIFKSNRYVTYVQGQISEHSSREYFYYIDHQGMLFLDDAKIKNFTSCFKEKKFLQFFFKMLKINNTGKYESEFPFFSPCGREKNYVRCNDLPIVFTHIFEVIKNNITLDYLAYGYAGDSLKFKFAPEKICMLPESGRVYHPGPEAVGGVGLVKSSLAIQLSSNFIYENTNNSDNSQPTALLWRGQKFLLTNEIQSKIYKLKNVK